ncbi:MAG: hypothetical protein E6H58_15555 [Betaproteobacteria bacterium]|nr:MAG: hypothetical protein E6H58_15555 [Betaproteobacteria bacterium]
MGKKQLLIGALALAGGLVAGVAQAHGRDDVQWSVTIGTPVQGNYFYNQPAPVVVQPAPDYWYHDRYRDHRGEDREPTRWDIDGDGIPNRFDSVYNPRWDQNGNGIPDRRERRYDRYGYGGWGR